MYEEDLDVARNLDVYDEDLDVYIIPSTYSR